MYIKDNYLPKNFRFVALAFIKIDTTEASITNGLSRLFQTARDIVKARKTNLGNIVIPLSMFRGYKEKYEAFIRKIVEMMEKKENDFISEISLTTKDAEEFKLGVAAFSSMVASLIEKYEICVDQ